jgi:hypothetical protein
MAKKKVTAEACSTGSHSGCMAGGLLLPLLIIVLAWVRPAVLWSQIVMTVAAALIVLGAHCPCKKK